MGNRSNSYNTGIEEERNKLDGFVNNYTRGFFNVTIGSNSSEYHDGERNDDKVSTEGLILVSLILWIFILIGIAGNLMVIYGVLSDRKMRASVTNLFIINLAVADFIILALGIPDTVLFSIDQGYLLGVVACKGLRYGIVLSWYASVMNQIALCIERYIAIVHPLKANILCNRRNTLIGIACIWPLSAAFAIPIPVFNVVGTPPNATDAKCATRFPGNHDSIFSAWKYAEMTLWYIVPMVILIVLYTIVGHRLFAGAEELHGGRKDKGESDALKARRGVIKMLVASVVLYLISYSPIQGMLVYTTFRPFPLHKRWMWHAFVISLVYVNSAANPILYSIFSQNFRRRFQRMVCFCSTKYRTARSLSSASCSQTVGQCPSNATKYSLVHLNRGHSEA